MALDDDALLELERREVRGGEVGHRLDDAVVLRRDVEPGFGALRALLAHSLRRPGSVLVPGLQIRSGVEFKFRTYLNCRTYTVP